MKSWSQVSSDLDQWLEMGLQSPEVVVNLANDCIGWPYVFGAWGERCTPSNRKARARDDYPTIVSKCQVLNGSKATCAGCKWHPGGDTLFYDCRGFTHWVLLKAAGIQIDGSGATTQYNNDNNWSEKGTIDNMPKDKVCCVFRKDSTTKKMEHTLLYDGNGNYIHCSGEVKKCAVSKYKATHYAIPKNLYPDAPQPGPEPGTAIVTGKNVALRYGPTTNAGIITRIATGTKLTIETPPAEWAYVTYNGKSGYMMKQYLIMEQTTAVVSGKNVALRYGPTTSAGVILRVPTGKIVQISTPPDNWEYLRYNNKTGYMMKEFIKE